MAGVRSEHIPKMFHSVSLYLQGAADDPNHGPGGADEQDEDRHQAAGRGGLVF